ncbi:hypothetical protein JCM19240_6774 [Vibrio maritimus]|uniref:Chitin-binding type-3 domain-containing protein n=1 Tax=Vibrio maritimus TaxID=990268 RepID=A0A090TEE2_9VIBR|nr:hypothetical protein JCM19240_6774 [Vibrio maritimus]
MNVSYALGDVVIYNGVKYQVITAHVSQANWTPNAEPTLFAPVQ